MLSWEMVSLSVLIASGTVVCVCAAVSSRCSQYSLKWWGCVRLLLSVMRLPAALRCLTESSSVSWPSKLKHTCTDTHTHTKKLLLLVFQMFVVLLFSLTFLSCALLYSFLFFCSLGPFCSTVFAPTLVCHPSFFFRSPLSTGVLCNWPVDSTLARISTVVTSGWCCWPLQS